MIDVAVGTGEPPSLIISKVPWRASTGASYLIHPLHNEEFFTHIMGRRAVVLHRGSAHGSPLMSRFAAGLLRGFTIGIDAELVTFSKRKEVSLKGYPAIEAVAEGRVVRLRSVERKVPRLTKDPLVAALRRLSPGRPVTFDLYWVPPNLFMPPQERTFDQLVQQVSGVRLWTVCGPGVTLPSLPVSSLPEVTFDLLTQGSCEQFTLRRGDTLYLPARRLHWTSQGIGSSTHTSLGCTPLVGADLIVVMAKDQLLQHDPRLAAPLPLWSSRAEDAVPSLIWLCGELTWAEEQSVTMCTVPLIMQALWKLGAISKPRTAQRSEAVNAANRSNQPKDTGGGGPPLRPRRWLSRERTYLAAWLAQCFALLCASCFGLWICVAACSLGEESEGRTRRTRDRKQAKEFKRKFQ